MSIEVFFSYSHRDEELRDELAKHLTILQREGVITTWSDRQIGAGDEWAGQIDAHLNSADIILLLISADFIASNYCYDIEMRRAMERHEARSARVVPVILRPVDWTGAPFGKLQAYPKDAKPITTWPNQDEAFVDVTKAIRKTAQQIQTHKSPTQVVRPDARKTLLGAVKQEVTSRLKQSLHNAVFITLGKEEQPEQVRRPWDAEIKIGQRTTKLPADTRIIDVFNQEEIGGKLLILGNPGAGKTTTLLDLAKELLNRATDQPDYPIPVLFNLSSFQDNKQLIEDWLLAELQLKYGVANSLGQAWRDRRQLLPLLDGLDELPPDCQERCVKAINQWLQSDHSPVNIVVCSRTEEYNIYPTKLNLSGAICLEALTTAQIQNYLTQANRADLWQTISHDTVLLDLVQTPLLLSMIVIAYDELSLEQWQTLTTTQERLGQLLDAYIRQMLHRTILSQTYGEKIPPTSSQTQRWLVWLAQQLREGSQDEFLIESMQPSLLKTKSQNWSYCLIAGLCFGLCFGLVFGLIVGLFFGLIVGLIIGLMIGLNVGLNTIEPVEAFDLKFSCFARKTFFQKLVDGLINGLLFGLLFGLLDGVIDGLIDGLIVGLVVGPTVGLVDGLLFGLIGGLKVDVQTPIIPNQAIIRSAQNVAWFVSFAVLMSLLLPAVLPGLLASILEPEQLSLIAAFSSFALIFSIFLYGGGLACIQHFSLRWVLYQNGYIPWNYARFLGYCTERLLLQRVGGRYRFIHKLLQDHFADMSP
jgi:GTPase SAR1 family protein